MIYLADLRVARLTVVSSLTIPGGGDGGAVDSLANADASGAGVFKSTTSNIATLRRLAAASDSLTIAEGTDVITFTLARAVIGTGATAHLTSVSLGPSAAASGATSVAAGSGATASGPYTAALGPSAAASGLGSSTAVGAGAAARVAGTINFGGVPIVRRVTDEALPTGHSLTTIRAAPLVALTTGTWGASATGDVATLVIPSGTVFFPETLRVWCEAVCGTPSSDLTLSAGMTTIVGTRVNFVDAMPIGLIDAPWASRVGAIATTKGLTAGTIFFTQGTTGGVTTGSYTLRCSIQGFLIET